MKISKYDEPTYGSYSYCTLNATRKELISKFGEPSRSDEDEDNKSQYQWNLTLEDGTIFYIYDWKEYRYIDADEKIDWHIGISYEYRPKINNVLESLKEYGFNVSSDVLP